MTPSETEPQWPPLPFAALQPTAETLQLWTQIVGKVRLALTPWLNHSWHVTLYVSARGLTTGLIPHGAASFDMEFDFLAHDLVIRATDGGERRIGLAAPTAAEFYARVLAALADLGVPAAIHPEPNEIPRSRAVPAGRPSRVTTPRSPAISGGRWCRSSACSPRFRTGFTASAARSTCSGAASIWR